MNYIGLGTIYSGGISGSYGNPFLGQYVKTLTKRQIEEQKEITKRAQKRAVEERKKLIANWKLSDLSEWRKKKLLEIIHVSYDYYVWERRLNDMKYFWILLGLAIFINFSKILEILKLIIK